MTAEEKEFADVAAERVRSSLSEPLRAIYVELSGAQPPHDDYANLLIDFERLAKEKDMLAAYERARDTTRNRTSPPGNSEPAWDRLWWLAAQEEPRLRDELAKDLSPSRADELAHVSSVVHMKRRPTHAKAR